MTLTAEQQRIKYAMEQGYKMLSCWIETSVMPPIEGDGVMILAYFLAEEDNLHVPVVAVYRDADHLWHSYLDPEEVWKVENCRAWLPLFPLDAQLHKDIDTVKFYHTC